MKTSTAQRKSLAAVYGMLQKHAAMLSFVEAFWVMAIIFLGMLPFLLLLQYRKHTNEPPPPEALPLSSQQAELHAEERYEAELVLH